jgi:hypothetical protein
VFVAVPLCAAAVALPALAAQSANEVTIFAHPPVAASDSPITLSGTVRSGRPGELVDLQAKDCGQSSFRIVQSARTQSGGRWATTFFPGIGTSVRAVWKGHTSTPVRIGQRAMLRFAPKANDRTRFVVSVVARAQFWRKKVVIERLNRERGVWRHFRSVVLTSQQAPGQFVWTSGEFTARLPRGTMLRALLPQSQAGSCYLLSYSLPLRTG